MGTGSAAGADGGGELAESGTRLAAGGAGQPAVGYPRLPAHGRPVPGGHEPVLGQLVRLGGHRDTHVPGRLERSREIPEDALTGLQHRRGEMVHAGVRSQDAVRRGELSGLHGDLDAVCQRGEGPSAAEGRRDAVLEAEDEMVGHQRGDHAEPDADYRCVGRIRDTGALERVHLLGRIRRDPSHRGLQRLGGTVRRTSQRVVRGRGAAVQPVLHGEEGGLLGREAAGPLLRDAL